MTDIEKMREAFNLELQKNYQNQKVNVRWNNERIAETIRKMENYSFNPNRKSSYYSKIFKIDERGGKKVLLAKRTFNTIIPSEDFFDVLYNAHLATGHGRRRKMWNYLKSCACYVPKLEISVFTEICNVCTNYKKNNKILPINNCEFKRGFLNTIDMSQNPDGEYRHIFYYQDIETKFSFLRPLKSKAPATASRELIKIILNLGGPGILHSARGRQFVETVIKDVHGKIPGSNIIVGKNFPEDDHVSQIIDKLRLWMRNKNSNEWSKGVYFVQFEMNCSLIENQRMPYKDMFGVLPKLGVNTEGMPEDVIESLKEESDLIKWRESQDQTIATTSKKNFEDKLMKNVTKQKDVQMENKNSSSSVQKSSRKKIAECLSSDQMSDDDDVSSVEMDQDEPPAIAEMDCILCWVCTQDDKPANFTCATCNAMVHEDCGVFDSSKETITCIMCMDESPIVDEVTGVDQQQVNIKEKDSVDDTAPN